MESDQNPMSLHYPPPSYSDHDPRQRLNLYQDGTYQEAAMALRMPGGFPDGSSMLPVFHEDLSRNLLEDSNRAKSQRHRNRAVRSHPPGMSEREEIGPDLYSTDDEHLHRHHGETGAGKSKFIQLCTQSKAVKVGHSLKSCTQDVGEHVFTFQNKRVHLVDTPCFDDTNRTDRAVLDEIATWFGIAHKVRIQLTGILYVHRITEPQMAGTALNNLQMFKKLCGHNYYPRVSLTTTFWDTVPKLDGETREKELIDTNEFWGQLVKEGSRVYRHYGDQNSALEILHSIIERRKDTRERAAPTFVRVQREMAEENKTLDETSAGQAVNAKILTERRRFEKELAQAKADWKEAMAKNDRKAAESYERYQKEVEQKLQRGYDEEKKLNVRLGEMEAKHLEGIAKLQQAVEAQQDLIEKLKSQNRDNEERLRHLPTHSSAAIALRRQIRQNGSDIEETNKWVDQQQKTLTRKRDLVIKAVQWAKQHPDTLAKVGIVGLKVMDTAMSAYHARKMAAQGSAMRNGWTEYHVAEVESEEEDRQNFWQQRLQQVK